MTGRQELQEALFCRFRIEDHIPADHLLRRIDWLLDFGALRHELEVPYSHAGRPSVDPELMIRMLLIGYPTLEWIDWFSNRRPLEPIGNIPPAEAEANYYAVLETEAMAAGIMSINLQQTRSSSVQFMERHQPTNDKRLQGVSKKTLIRAFSSPTQRPPVQVSH